MKKNEIEVSNNIEYDSSNFLNSKSANIFEETLTTLKDFHKIPANHPIFQIESENGHFILKNYFQQFENEIFTTNFANQIGKYFNCFDSPEVILLSTNTKKFHNFINIASQLESKKYKGNRNDTLTLKKLSNVKFVGLMEFKIGISMEFIKESDLNDSILNKIGNIIAFDILINNWDRFPLSKIKIKKIFNLKRISLGK